MNPTHLDEGYAAEQGRGQRRLVAHSLWGPPRSRECWAPISPGAGTVHRSR
ncbi:MAG: hypothetical protein MZW92_09455 [Comamonadaceae bacterium]|nr:hypothetical protein [Comamonadaceae bacterium]